MELKLDVKTLVIGIAIGVVVTAVIGASDVTAYKSDFGIAIPSATGDGSALVRTADDGLYVINAKSGMAVRVLQASVRAEPYDHRVAGSKFFYLSAPSKEEAPKY
jgi:hypothetical protein